MSTVPAAHLLARGDAAEKWPGTDLRTRVVGVRPAQLTGCGTGQHLKTTIGAVLSAPRTESHRSRSSLAPVFSLPGPVVPYDLTFVMSDVGLGGVGLRDAVAGLHNSFLLGLESGGVFAL